MPFIPYRVPNYAIAAGARRCIAAEGRGRIMVVRLTPAYWRALARHTPEGTAFRRYIVERLRNPDVAVRLDNVAVVIPQEHIAAFRRAYRAEFGREYPEER